MIINLTTPITVDGHHITDFEAAVEVTVTDRGSRHDAPEWNVDGYFVDAGSFVKRTGMAAGGAWRSNILPCPDTLRHFVDAYLDTKEGADSITCSLQECGEAL